MIFTSLMKILPTLRKKFRLKFQMSLPKIIKPFVQVQICPKLSPHKGYNQKSMG